MASSVASSQLLGMIDQLNQWQTPPNLQDSDLNAIIDVKGPSEPERIRKALVSLLPLTDRVITLGTDVQAIYPFALKNKSYLYLGTRAGIRCEQRVEAFGKKTLGAFKTFDNTNVHCLTATLVGCEDGTVYKVAKEKIQLLKLSSAITSLYERPSFVLAGTKDGHLLHLNSSGIEKVEPFAALYHSDVSVVPSVQMLTGDKAVFFARGPWLFRYDPVAKSANPLQRFDQAITSLKWAQNRIILSLSQGNGSELLLWELQGERLDPKGPVKRSFNEEIHSIEVFDDLILAGSQKGNIFVLNLTDATDVTSFSVNTPVEDLKLVGGELFVVAPQGQESIMVNFKPISDLNLSEKLKTAASDLQYSEPGAWEQHQFSEEIKNKIYYCMWLCKGCPKNIEDFGKKAFHDELPCTSEEKAKAVKLCAKLIQFQLEFPKAVVV